MIKSILGKTNNEMASYISFSSLSMSGNEMNSRQKTLKLDKDTEKKNYFKK